MRAFASVLAFVLFGSALTAQGARAEGRAAVVVLDRGASARTNAERDEKRAVRIVRALAAHGDAVRFVVYGSHASGRMRAAELRGDPAEALEKARGREGWNFEGPTDPRLALDLLVRTKPPDAPLLVFLVGPFEGEAATDEEAGQALERWNERAPEGSRVVPLGLAPPRHEALAAAKGLVAKGAVVLSVGEVEVEPAPFSPLALARPDPPDLEATVRVPLEVLAVGEGPEGALLDAVPTQPGDRVETMRADPDEAVFRFRRSGRGALEATLGFRARADLPGVVWVADPPEPRTWEWSTLRRDAALEAVAGGPPPPFVATGVHADHPVSATYRLLRTRVGDEPTFTASAGGDDALPDGLVVTFSDEEVRDEQVLTRLLTVTYAPRPGKPEDRAGEIVLAEQDGAFTFRIPYHVSAPPGHVRVVFTAPEKSTPLPMAADDAPWTLEVEALDSNVPRTVRLVARIDPTPPPGLALELSSGGTAFRWDVSTPLDLPTGVAYAARPRLPEGASGFDGTVAVRLSDGPVVLGTAGPPPPARVRARRPRLLATEAAPRYRLADDGTVTADPPLRLEVDPDGGPPAWRLRLAQTPPTVVNAPGAAVDLQVVPAVGGGWELVPHGSWRGPSRNLFSDRAVKLPVEVHWTRGPVEGLSGPLRIRVPARWGAAGWVLLGLAVLALALGAWGLLQMRPPPVEGTLLYVSEERPGAVGRLDLAPVGRRSCRVVAEGRGRLGLGGNGPVVAKVRPSRVGGLLAVEGPDGETEEHLLADGLTVRAPGHRLRYVSPQPEDGLLPPVDVLAGDLLGPEYELHSGRIAALGPAPGEGPPATPPPA